MTNIGPDSSTPGSTEGREHAIHSPCRLHFPPAQAWGREPGSFTSSSPERPSPAPASSRRDNRAPFVLAHSSQSLVRLPRAGAQVLVEELDSLRGNLLRRRRYRHRGGGAEVVAGVLDRNQRHVGPAAFKRSAIDSESRNATAGSSSPCTSRIGGAFRETYMMGLACRYLSLFCS